MNSQQAAERSLMPAGKDHYRFGMDNAGEKASNAKLTWSNVRKIRELGKEGHTQSSIAQQFGVTRSNVGRILLEETWLSNKDPLNSSKSIKEISNVE